jgi:ATP-dependent Clp protease ATP-binding subunit ClpC
MPFKSPTNVPLSEELEKALLEAEDIARQTSGTTTSLHFLLAFFTFRNQAERLLRGRGISEDLLLARIGENFEERKDTLEEILERATRVAASCGARSVGTLHAVVALTRSRDSVAYRLLGQVMPSVSALRTRALTLLTGAVPRWLDAPPHPHASAHASELAYSVRPSPARKAVPEGLPRRPRDPGVGQSHGIHWAPPVVSKSASHPGRRLSPPPSPRGLNRSPAETVPNPECEISPVQGPSHAEPIVAIPVAAPPDRPSDKGHWHLDPAEYPWLARLGRNLSQEASEGRLDRLVGRNNEVAQLIDILGKRRANNPCLIGEPGVGKTAVVEGLAIRLLRCPPEDPLGQTIVVGLDVGSLLIGTHLRGSFSEKLEGIKEEVRRSGGRIVVFLDELHTLVGAGATGDGPLDAANELKTALARGEFPCIGATTYDEYLKHIEPDAALRRRFVPVLVREPTVAEAIAMIERIGTPYAAHHRVSYTPEALKAAVELSARYIHDRYLPDKAIALIDLAGSRCRRNGETTVGPQHIAALVAERVEIPVEQLLDSNRKRLLGLESLLTSRIIGHERPISQIGQALRRSAGGFRGERPQATMLFLGPTGVGKTETAKALARILHGDESALLRFDLSEFTERHSMSRLVGAPPGYVGHDSGGELTEAVRRRPGRIILLDDIDKAHHDVLMLLLQILDDGRLTDSHGRTVRFSESIIVMTSSAGTREAAGKRTIGFEPHGQSDLLDRERALLQNAEQLLPPELWSRIEERLVFLPLRPEELRRIAHRIAEDSSRRLQHERGVTYELMPEALDYLLEQSDPEHGHGARRVRHVLQRLVESPIASRILEGRLHADEHVVITLRTDSGLGFLAGEDRQSLSQRPAASSIG